MSRTPAMISAENAVRDAMLTFVGTTLPAALASSPDVTTEAENALYLACLLFSRQHVTDGMLPGPTLPDSARGTLATIRSAMITFTTETLPPLLATAVAQRQADDPLGPGTLSGPAENGLYMALVIYSQRKVSLGEFAGPPLYFGGAVPYVEPQRNNEGRGRPMPPHRGVD